MLIRSEFDLSFTLPAPSAMVAMLRLHPSLDSKRIGPEKLYVTGADAAPIATDQYMDCFGNRCDRFLAPEGTLRLNGQSTVEIEAIPDAICNEAVQHQIEDLPPETLQFLLSSRYCQVDSLSLLAGDLFSHTTPGWARAINIRDWVHSHVRFDYKTARSTKTALDVFTERVGVCRDFQHLAITLTRAMNIPARYVTGYLGDIRVPSTGLGDFSAWYEVFLHNRWWTMDARHNDPRIGRVLMATGRDATDVALTTSFGIADLSSFHVESYEIDPEDKRVPLPTSPAIAGV